MADIFDPDEAFIASPDFDLLGNPNARLESTTWGIAFPGPHPKGCLLANERIGTEEDSPAQLVVDRQTGVVIVRKFRHRAYGLNPGVETRLENEVRIASYLEDLIRSRAAPRPLISQIFYAHDIRPADSNVWSRASFWSYYNNGDMDKFIDMYRAATPPTFPPVAIIARFLWQTLRTIKVSFTQLSPLF